MSTYDKKMSLARSLEFSEAVADVIGVALWSARDTMLLAPFMLMCGSIRRQRPEIGDIDVMLVMEGDLTRLDLPDDWSVKEKRGSGWFEMDGDRMMVDLWLCPPESVGAFAMFLTGPPELNVVMRQNATGKGLMLSQYGLFKPRVRYDSKGKMKRETGERVDRPHGQPVHVEAAEKQLCEALGWNWRPPTERDEPEGRLL